jgi:drug/metabolite transporter (DMT)-like permease
MASPAPFSTPPRETRSVDPRERAALLLALALVLIWGSNFSVQKAVFSAITPGGFLFARYLIMPICAVLLLWQRYGARWPRLDRGEWWKLARLALLGHVLHVGLVTFGIHWSTAFSSSVILACGPIFTLLFLRWAGIERLSRAQIAGVAVACCGVLLFLSDKLLGAQWQASSGDLVLLVAAAFFSAYTVAAKPMFERHGSVLVMAYVTLLGSLPLVLLSLPAGIAVDWTAVPPVIWAGFAYSVLLSAFVGWIVWGWINAVRGVARTAPLMYLMPPVAGLIAWVATGEGYTLIKLGGAAVTLLGVALAQFAHSRSEPTPESVTVVD